MRAGTASKKLRRNCECHEDDPLLINARKSRRGNKNRGKKQSAGCNVSRTSRKVLSSTRCRKCASTPRHRQRCSVLDPRMSPVRGKRFHPRAGRAAGRTFGESPTSRKGCEKWGTHLSLLISTFVLLRHKLSRQRLRRVMRLGCAKPGYFGRNAWAELRLTSPSACVRFATSGCVRCCAVPRSRLRRPA